MFLGTHFPWQVGEWGVINLELIAQSYEQITVLGEQETEGFPRAYGAHVSVDMGFIHLGTIERLLLELREQAGLHLPPRACTAPRENQGKGLPSTISP